MATPHVSGAAALIQSANPHLTPGSFHFRGKILKKKATVAVVKLGGRYFQVLMESLIQFLKQVKEHRCSRGQRHPLWFILLIVIVGIMQGYQGYRDLADWAKSHQELLASLGSFQPKSILSYSTIRRAIVGIDCDDFIVQFNEWAAKLLPDTPEMAGLSIDGKSLRSTLTNYRSEKQNFVAIVSAFCHQTNLVLAKRKIGESQNFRSSLCSLSHRSYAVSKQNNHLGCSPL